MNLLAYLDPGTGSFILQVLVGGAFGSLLVLKHVWHHVKDAAAHATHQIRGRDA